MMSRKIRLYCAILGAITITTSYAVFADEARVLESSGVFKNNPVTCTPKLYTDSFGLSDAGAKNIYQTSLAEAGRVYQQVKGSPEALAANLPAQPQCVVQSSGGQHFIHMGRSLSLKDGNILSKVGYVTSVCDKVSTVNLATNKMSPDALAVRSKAWAFHFIDEDRIMVFKR